METSEISPDCPYCGSKITGKVFWGFPVNKKEWSKDWSFKEVEWKCRDCGKRWGRTDHFHE